MAKQSVIEQLLASLTADERQEVLRAAGSGERVGRKVSDAVDPAEFRLLAPLLLRRIQVPSELFKEIIREANISLTVPERALEVEVPFVRSSASHVAIPITELSAASLIMWELSLRVAAVLRALEVPELLETNVKLGSVNFAFGGGPLLVAGMGFIIAAHEAFPPGRGADFAFYGGAIMAILGIIDMVVNWEKLVAEIPKIQSETALNEVKVRLTQLEIQKAERELAPPSALVPESTVYDQARRFGIDPAMGMHLINEVMPAYDALIANRNPIVVTHGPGGKASASASGV